jgi:hypothetical protein
MSSQTDDTQVKPGGGGKRHLSDALGVAFLIGGAIAVVVAMAGWLYFLGWLAWRFFIWILN